MINARLKQKIESFDIISYLENNNVSFKNSSNNILICCPFCEEQKFKAGILKIKGIWNCFKCNEKGNLIKLISKISECRFSEAKKIIECSYTNYDQIDDIEKEIESLLTEQILDKKRVLEINIPPSLSLNRLVGIQKKLFHQYLIKRNFFDLEFFKKFGVTACISGYYKNRLLIPIYYKKKMVTFLTRDVTGRADAKYKNLPSNKSILTAKEVLYGYDYCTYGNDIILVEGVFDWFRVYQSIKNVDDYSVLAVLGKTMTISQQIILQKLNPKKVIIFFDSGTNEDSEKLKMSLSPFINNISIVGNLEEGSDPADLSVSAVLNKLNLQRGNNG